MFILMEYADGGTLEERWLQQCDVGTHFEEKVVMSWGVQLISAVAYIHSLKVLHRDIKLANILLTAHNQIKLGDFGLARTLDTQSFLAHTCCGTPYYISPELCKGEPYDSKADVWALGCVLYELCALAKPFKGANLHAVVMSICTTRPAPLSGDFSDGLRDIITSMLQKDPRERPAAAKLLQDPHMYVERRSPHMPPLVLVPRGSQYSYANRHCWFQSLQECRLGRVTSSIARRPCGPFDCNFDLPWLERKAKSLETHDISFENTKFANSACCFDPDELLVIQGARGRKRRVDSDSESWKA